MHDPLTVAWEIKNPFIKKKHGYRPSFITIWHVDPQKDGTDDSCGWFMRSRHGNPEMLKKIKSVIDFNFDRTFTSEESGTTYYTGYFSPKSGMPNFSTMGIALDMFSTASWEFFKHNRKKQTHWMQQNLYKILHFAENTIDSLKDNIEGTFRIGTASEWKREDALDEYANTIYGWLLRSNRKWYHHPKWHIHHWSIQFHPLQQLKRRYWDKCSICGKRGFKGAAMGSWSGDKIWHAECDHSIKPMNKNLEEVL